MFIQIISINLYLPVFFPSLPSFWGPVIPSHPGVWKPRVWKPTDISSQNKTLKNSTKNPRLRSAAVAFRLKNGSHERGQHIVLPSVAHPPLSLAPEWSDLPGKKRLGVCGEHDMMFFGGGSRGGLLLKASHQKKNMMDPWDDDIYFPTLVSLTQPMDPEKKEFERLIFPTKYVIPKS